jgi:hypothetical protein
MSRVHVVFDDRGEIVEYELRPQPSSNPGRTSCRPSGVAIRNRTDALLWQLVDQVFNGRDSREAVTEWELDHHRARAEEILGREARIDRLVQLLRETDPRTIGRRVAA